MVAPSIPGWVFLLLGIFYLLAFIALLALMRAFGRSIYELLHPSRDGNWRHVAASGLALAGVVVLYFAMTAEGRSERAKVDAATSISTLEPKSFSTRFTGSGCRVALADGPPWEGNETKLLDTIRADADAFEAEGWTVTRYRPSDLRRGQLGFEYEPWQARATKGDAEVVIGVDRTFRYTVVVDGCEPSIAPDEKFVTEIERFPDTPAANSSATIVELDETLRTAVALVTHRLPTSTDQVLAHGVSSPLDCFVSSHSDWALGSDELETLRRRLVAEEWTIVESLSSLIAVQGDRAVVASMSRNDGLWIRSYPTGCVDVETD